VPRIRKPPVGQNDLFSSDPEILVGPGLAAMSWPPQERFPVNHPRAHVRDVLADDLLASSAPLLIAGYSSIAELVELVAGWRRARGDPPGTVRLLLGSEPFPSRRTYFGSAVEAFTDEVRGYWLEHSVSVRLSAKVIRALEVLDAGLLQVKVIPGPPHLHAKVYVGDGAATVGSSNFTGYGLARQLEANARFEKADDPARYGELAGIAENLWSSGLTWDEEFRRLLHGLLQVVDWTEALARACAELLEGDWTRNVAARPAFGDELWPSQRAGIAQALWVVENLGSVLVADATGSGKTRMGAHLVAAVRARLLDTGRLRRDRDLTTLVCPPAVVKIWQREALIAGVTVMPVSHGLLSRPDPAGQRIEAGQVARAQVLAVDEAHNYLSMDANRTRRVRDSVADHVLLFTATPISRGTQDLLSLVGLLGADNFGDDTLAVLEQLDRGARTGQTLTEQQRACLRQEIQRFTVRRTKSALNDLVAQYEGAYRHPESGRVCRYPAHEPRKYPTGETASDEQAAEEIRDAATELLGVVLLGRKLRVPDVLRREVTDQQWLESRLKAARGLARHNVLGAMRSSRAALVEHLAGTTAALQACGLAERAKAQRTGDVIGKLAELAGQGPPGVELTCPVPEWLQDKDAWLTTCAGEVAIYRRILDCSEKISSARERTKAELLARQAAKHRLVLAFDRHPITLAAVQAQIPKSRAEVLIATGESPGPRQRVEELFARDSQAHAIALCSDALNEGRNLQGAATLVHLDLPTTLRVAEQRVGRVDRMDSPHDHVTIWWPEDGKAFATRAIDLLLSRRQASESLLGSNLPMPAFTGHPEDAIVDVGQHIRDLDRPDLTWDGIGDALDPVRRLVEGGNALVPAAVYAEHRQTQHRVMARVAPVAAGTPWAFLALSGTQHGAPRWLMLEGEQSQATVGVEAVAERLRVNLRDDPPNVAFDENCERWLDRFLAAAAQAEMMLLPRRMQRALEQMTAMTHGWREQAWHRSDYEAAEQWGRLRRIARPEPGDDDRLDPYLVGEVWWDMVRPLFADIRRGRRRRRYTRLRDLDALLLEQPLSLAAVHEALQRVPFIEPVDKRVSAAIIGVPQ
jgi:SNF2-related domain/Helicase conserved C-terminal domain